MNHRLRGEIVHVIKNIEIHGFRGQSKVIKLQLDRYANFLIGRNGTGKTTLINLINSALSLNYDGLRRSSWTKIIIRFKEDGTNIVPNIEITRSSEGPSAVITFSYRETSKSDLKKFNFPARERNLVRSSSGRIVQRHGRLRETENHLNEQVGDLYSTTWLSLSRADINSDGDPWEQNRSSIPDVDRKLEDSFTKLISYFSRLDGKVADETQDFQKYWFLSFLSPAADSDTEILRSIDLEKEETELRAIFHKFEMTPDTFENGLAEYFDRLRAILSRKDHNILQGWQEIGVVYDAMRLHTLVGRWQELQNAQKTTYKPKTDYIRVASDLLYNKNIKVDRSNQIQVINQDNIYIPISALSSGEKQLLIFLSETLLQEGKSHIFLADEPELSLHVEWQVELVPSLLQLNPNAQVLFATHSPDIVGQFQQNIIHMEDLV